MKRARYNDVKYWKTIYPMIDLTFMPREPGGRAESRPVLLDSGAPFSAMPHDVIDRVGVIDEELDVPVAMFGLEVRYTYRCRLEIDGRTIWHSFGRLPPEAYEWLCKDQRRPIEEHRGLPLYGIIGTDFFRRVVVTFDDQTQTVFLGRRDSETSRSVLALIQGMSDDHRPLPRQLDLLKTCD